MQPRGRNRISKVANQTNTIKIAKKINIPTRNNSEKVRSPSPARQLRMQEKEDLQDLNSRFANFISHTRQIEDENAHLSTLIAAKFENSFSENEKARSLYEAELNDVRRLLDTISSEKAQLQVTVGRLTAESNEKAEIICDFEKCMDELRRQNKLNLVELTKKTAKCDIMGSSLKETSDLLKKTTKNVENLENQLTIARNQLEAETVARVEAENTVQSLRETITFNNSLQSGLTQPQNVSNVFKTPEISQYSLQEAYDDIREHLSKEWSEINSKMESLNRTKIENLNRELVSKEEYSLKLMDRVEELSRRLRESSSETGRLSERVADLERRLRDKQSELDGIKIDNECILSAKMAEIEDLRGSLDSALAEQEDLFDAKLRLDTEIAAYRNLVEAEEGRLNISGQGCKRRRLDTCNYRSVSFSTGKVVISDADELGESVTVCNNGDRVEDIGGWLLCQKVGAEMVSYRFNEGTKLGVNESCKVWSAGMNEDGLVCEKRWLTGESCIIRLIDSDGIETSKREIKRVEGFVPLSKNNGGCVVM